VIDTCTVLLMWGGGTSLEGEGCRGGKGGMSRRVLRHGSLCTLFSSQWIQRWRCLAKYLSTGYSLPFRVCPLGHTLCGSKLTSVCGVGVGGGGQQALERARWHGGWG
jgi:hypothetical protein